MRAQGSLGAPSMGAMKGVWRTGSVGVDARALLAPTRVCCFWCAWCAQYCPHALTHTLNRAHMCVDGGSRDHDRGHDDVAGGAGAPARPGHHPQARPRVCVCAYVRVRVCACALLCCLRVCVCAFARTCMCLCLCLCLYLCMAMGVGMCLCMWICECECACVYAYAYVHVPVYMPVHARARTSTRQGARRAAGCFQVARSHMLVECTCVFVSLSSRRQRRGATDPAGASLGRCLSWPVPLLPVPLLPDPLLSLCRALLVHGRYRDGSY